MSDSEKLTNVCAQLKSIHAEWSILGKRGKGWLYNPDMQDTYASCADEIEEIIKGIESAPIGEPL